MKAVPESEWKWFGCAGHLIVANNCLVRLHTRIGDYRVSTVGAYFRDGIKGGQTFDDGADIGYERKYETYVFNVAGDGEHGEGEMVTASEIDSLGANSEVEAHRNHMTMCHRYAQEAAK